MRKYKGIHSVADFVLCDRRTIDPWVLNREPSDSARVFSVEKPTRSEFALFQRAIHLISSASLRLPTALGSFVGKPHRPDIWFTNVDNTHLFKTIDESSYLDYSVSTDSRSARHSTSFNSPILRTGQCPHNVRASVMMSLPTLLYFIPLRQRSNRLLIVTRFWNALELFQTNPCGRTLWLMGMAAGFTRVLSLTPL